ncbi:MAG TPA: DNA-processing protein DprA [Thermodesulfobacteriota bacterium]|nr:DNA-processing protein DprA [Thermodesulfobacteriota bacterium]
MTDRQSLYYWLALNRIPGVGAVIYRRLLERFETPEKVFRADPDSLSGVEGIRSNTAQAIVKFKKAEKIDRELDDLEKNQVKVLTSRDLGYPALLAQIHDPPPFLYYRGELSELTSQILAVVGSRMASAYGIRMTERLAGSLTKNGLAVVSGMARGIDTAAHYGALMARGKTIAVLGSGLDVVYPPENQKLFDQIVEQGLVFSEFPLGTLPERQNFPVRNRIISGMALGVVIVEATLKSGSLITARLALDQGREVFAVPGSIESFKSSGTHRLIKQGAKLVENAQDVLEELKWSVISENIQEVIEPPSPVNTPAFSSQEKKIWDILLDEPVHVDHMVRQTEISIAPLLSILLEMEIKGWIKQLPGKYFKRA